MTRRNALGEFEQLVLLAILQEKDQAFGLEVRRQIEARTGKPVSRGAFYTTVDRLEQKGYLGWTEAPPGGRRGGAPQRLFAVSEPGLEALRESRRVLLGLWQGIEDVLEEGGR